MDFRARLEAAAARTNSLICLGLDPELPQEADADALIAANARLIEATAGLVSAYKLNLAFYVALGSAGVAAMEETLRRLPPETIRILDAKWGDIGNTSTAYTRAAFERWEFDAVTANPYLGPDSLAPFLADPSRGVFILDRTSNPGASAVQEVRVSGEPLYLRLAREIPTWSAHANVGLVVGATAPAALREVREAAPDVPILAPGVGAQGGDLAAALAAGLDSRGGGMLIPVSRGIAQAADPRAATMALRDAVNVARTSAREAAPGSTASVSPELKALAVALADAGCLRFGQFTLASGRVSPFYFDLRLLVTYPALLQQAAAGYGRVLASLSYDRIAGIPYAAMPIATAVSLHMQQPMIYPRREAKSYGTGRMIEGRFEAGETAVVLDDVITTGGSKLEAIKTLEAGGLKVRDIVVLIDREEGGREAIEAEGYHTHAVLRLGEVLDALVEAGRLTADERRRVLEMKAQA
ncbi:MAG: orotidine-5'-phosphate decarboxylase [Anaerolineae bacterium]